MPLPTLLVPGSLTLPSGETVPGTPIDHITAWIRHRMPEFGSQPATVANRVLVVQSETGSGKSTVLPVSLFRILRSERNKAATRYSGPSVLCTQPRVLTAVSLVADVSQASWATDIARGITVGYTTGPLKEKPASGLIYATIGTLAMQLQLLSDADIMGLYKIIIIDEAHERSIEADICMYKLKMFLLRCVGNARMPFVVLASATIDMARMAAYFGVSADNCLRVVGRAWPVRVVHHAMSDPTNYMNSAIEVCKKIHKDNPDDPPESCDIMVFMPGAMEALFVVQGLQDVAGMLTLVVNKDVVASQTGDYLKIFAPPVPGVRRVIVTTPVAETGVTVETLRYVVDSGWSRTTVMFPLQRTTGLVTVPTPKARSAQRKGRAGRVAPGEYYPLYDAETAEILPDSQLPDILTQPLDLTLLHIMTEQLRTKPTFRIEDLDLLDRPPAEIFVAAATEAYLCGFIECDPQGTTGWLLTPAGQLASQFSSRLAPGTVRTLLSAHTWMASVSDLATMLAAGLTGAKLVDPGFKEPHPYGDLPPGASALLNAAPKYITNRKELTLEMATKGGGKIIEPEMYYYRLKLLISDDHIEHLLLFELFSEQLRLLKDDHAALDIWCKNVGLDLGQLIALAEMRESLLSELSSVGLDPFANDNLRLINTPAVEFTSRVRALKQCLYDGHRGQLLELDKDNVWYVSRQGVRVAPPPLFRENLDEKLTEIGVTGATRRAKPRWLLTTSKLRLKQPRAKKQKPPTLQYTISAGLISVLDGWVDPDETFDLPILAKLADE